MNPSRIAAVLAKEWAEARKNKMVIGGMALLPIAAVIMAVLTAHLLMGADEREWAGFVPPAELAHLTEREAFIALMGDQHVLYLLLVPMIIPVSMSAYSIVGEKETRSLEPLLATPVTTLELLVAKLLAAVVPATLLGWLAFVLSSLGTLWVTTPGVTAELLRLPSLLAILLLAPLLAVTSTAFALLVSSRSDDVRAAQSIAGLGVLPLLGVAIALLMGQVYLQVGHILLAALGLAALDALLLTLTVRLFDREAILTRWR